MDFSFLPLPIYTALNNSFWDKIYEIRMRVDFPITINYNNKRAFLGNDGTTLFIKDAIICTNSLIEETINNLTEHSLYAFNEQIKQGFITTKNGIRIGIAGECVYDDNKIITIKKITSLNIRLPHLIEDCSYKIYSKIFQNNIKNTLIISPPTCGKTTILKDLALKLNKFYNKSILIIDERGEFVDVNGINIDKIKFCNKLYAFSYGIRSMSPDIVIMDELSTESDWVSASFACDNGVNIIASCHAKSKENLINKKFFISNVFERYVFLKHEEKKGEIDCILDKNFNLI